jgi:hypothetical protein
VRKVCRRALALSILGGLSACARHEQDEIAWAKSALARNPQLEVLASDAEKGVITVRERDSGEVRALRLDDIAAGPVSQLSTTAVPAPAAPAGVPEVAQASPPDSTTASAPATAVAEAPPSLPASAVEPAPSAPPASVTTAKEPPDYKVERSDGRIRVTGPGVSIVTEKTVPSTQASATSAAKANGLPVICEGQRSMHIDNRTINVEGDAVIASGGCELYITNSKLTGTGAGISVQDAIVHVDNSIVKGVRASIDAEGAARLYTRNTQFEGLSRRSDQAMISDLGGNRWK